MFVHYDCVAMVTTQDLVLGEESQDSDDDVSDDVASDVSDSDGVASDDDGDVSDDDNIDWGVAVGVLLHAQ